jgi:hypothetical protein
MENMERSSGKSSNVTSGTGENLSNVKPPSIVSRSEAKLISFQKELEVIITGDSSGTLQPELDHN